MKPKTLPPKTLQPGQRVAPFPRLLGTHFVPSRYGGNGACTRGKEQEVFERVGLTTKWVCYGTGGVWGVFEIHLIIFDLKLLHVGVGCR